AGEDGRVQAQLEQIGVPYTGSGPAASRRAMKKSLAKQWFQRHGVPTLPFRVIQSQASWSANSEPSPSGRGQGEGAWKAAGDFAGGTPPPTPSPREGGADIPRISLNQLP